MSGWTSKRALNENGCFGSTPLPPRRGWLTGVRFLSLRTFGSVSLTIAFATSFAPAARTCAVSDKNLTPVSQPNVEGERASTPKQPFSFTATFEVQPEIENVKFEGFELFRPKVEVADKLIEEQMEGLRLRHAALKAPGAGASRTVLCRSTSRCGRRQGHQGRGREGVQRRGRSGPAALGQTTRSSSAKRRRRGNGGRLVPGRAPAWDFGGGEAARGRITVGDLKEHVLPNLDDEFAKGRTGRSSRSAPTSTQTREEREGGRSEDGARRRNRRQSSTARTRATFRFAHRGRRRASWSRRCSRAHTA